MSASSPLPKKSVDLLSDWKSADLLREAGDEQRRSEETEESSRGSEEPRQSGDGEAPAEEEGEEGPSAKGEGDPFEKILRKVGAPEALLPRPAERTRPATLNELKELQSARLRDGLSPQTVRCASPLAIGECTLASQESLHLTEDDFNFLAHFAEEADASQSPRAREAEASWRPFEEARMAEALREGGVPRGSSEDSRSTALASSEGALGAASASSSREDSCVAPLAPEVAPEKAVFCSEPGTQGFESGFKLWSACDDDKRNAADVDALQLQECPKKRIWVLHRGVCTPVSWYSDTSASDVKSAVFCAVDAFASDLAAEDFSAGETDGGWTDFCLRRVEPLPQKVDLDSSSLFFETATVDLRQEVCSPEAAGEAPGFLWISEREESPPVSPSDEKKRAGCRAPVGEVAKVARVKVALGRPVYFSDFASLEEEGVYVLERCSRDEVFASRPGAGEEPTAPEEASVFEARLERDRFELERVRRLACSRWRRLLVKVDAPLHAEAQFAFKRMTQGSNLLKHTRFGQPHLRQFQLSADRRRLLWYSSSKAVGEAVVHLSDVKGICVGQHSATFRNFRLPALKHLSFSLVLGAEEEADSTADSAEDGGRAFSCDSQGDALKAVVLRGPLEEDAQTLDLTCKDEAEFDLWLCGLKALVAFHKNVLLSKTDLLSHSKRFREAVQRRQVEIQLTKLPPPRESLSLKDFVDLPKLTYSELEEKYADMEETRCRLEEEGAGYVRVVADSASVDDRETEFLCLQSLMQKVKRRMQVARKNLDELKAMRESARRGSSAETASSLSLDAREGDPLSSAQERVLEKGSGESAASETDNRPARESDEAFVNDGDLDASSEERDSALAEQSPRGEATSSDAKAVVAISSEGEVLQKAPLPGLTFEERFRLYGGGSAAAAAKGPTPADVNDATSSAPVVLPRLEDLQSRVVSGLHALLDKAATAAAKAAEATAAAARAAKESETQKPLDLAVAAASAAFGLQGPSPEIESEVSVEEGELTKRINERLWQAQVDLENIQDILVRLKQHSDDALWSAVAAPLREAIEVLGEGLEEINSSVAEKVHAWSSKLSSLVGLWGDHADEDTLPAADAALHDDRRFLRDGHAF